jgi:glycosyltransferase involved in cell wall biosynthesis
MPCVRSTRCRPWKVLALILLTAASVATLHCARLLKLSVITPTLNQGPFIERAILSVLDQGYGRLEYLVVDGGSTDETVEVIRRYEDRIDWWVSEPDEGQTEAINKGLARASGDVIAYLNSDDYYLPGAFETALGALEQNGASWVAGAAINVDEEDRPRETPLGQVWVPTAPDHEEYRPPGPLGLVIYPWCVAQPASFWRRELFDRYGGFRRDMHYAFDVEFMTRLAIEGELPLLLPDKRLAACVLHNEAKSSVASLWDPEYQRMRRLHRRRLSLAERLRLRRLQLGKPLRPLTQPIRHRVVGPSIKFAGDLLEHVPEPIRPKIRTRDRRAP